MAKPGGKRPRKLRHPPLTQRQQNFINHYIEIGHVPEATRRAGYSACRGYKSGYATLARPDVAAQIAAARAAAQQRSGVTMDRVIAELAKLAFADPRDLFTADGRLKPIHLLDDASAASIAALDVTIVAGGSRRRAGAAKAATASAENAAAAEGDVVLEVCKIKRWDKTKALELLGRYLGLFKDHLEFNVSADLATAIEAARKRSQQRRDAEPLTIEVTETDNIAGRDVDA